MAIVKCSNCNGDISDRANECIHCGHIIFKENPNICSECGNMIKKGEARCSKCGCPIFVKNKPGKKCIIIAIITLLAIISAMFGVIKVNKMYEQRIELKASEQYERNLFDITGKMLEGAADAEKCCNKRLNVWKNSIWKKSDLKTDKYTKTNGVFNDDFNDSLNILEKDAEFVNIINGIIENNHEVNMLIKNMKNPPKEWEKEYKDLMNYYENYVAYIDLAIYPKGSYNSYSEDCNKADAAFNKAYGKMRMHLGY